MSEPFLVPWSDRLDRVHSPTPSPEEALIEAEELHLAGLVEHPETRRELQATPEQIHAALARIEPEQREAIVAYLAAGRSQAAIAEELGISQPSVHGRIHRGIRAMKWVMGPGSLFTWQELERDCARVVSPIELRALSTYWRTTSKKAAGAALGITSSGQYWNLLDGAIKKLTGKFRHGFDELGKWGQYRVQMTPEPKRSAVELFVGNLVFGEGKRIASVTLFAAYERTARAIGRAARRDAVTEAIRERGAVPGTVRVPWSSQSVRGFRGVALSSPGTAAYQPATA
ncbi:MAG TPA: sigma-70 family RNA polymerase sigma factor [Polyangiaceae bacterium]|nr:sigma-70 family RNA polymerase sigma factor [Polyangiaceae bacterium]